MTKYKHFLIDDLKGEQDTNLWRIARDNYRMVKICFDKKSYVACLVLLQQSYELYIKGLLKLNGIKFEKNHSIIEHLKSGKEKIPLFAEILENEEYKEILELLGKKFIDIRYGNTGGIGFGKHFFDICDEIEIMFDKCFFESMKSKNPNVHYKDWSFEKYRKIHQVNLHSWIIKKVNRSKFLIKNYFKTKFKK